MISAVMLVIALAPVPPQDTIVVRGERPAPARVQATVSAADARAQGAISTAQLVARVPFVLVRSARGESAIALRGARREQVLVTLDGMPLNDPSTGMADVADLPMAGIGSATVMMGANPLATGASTGTLALTSAPTRLLSVAGGAYGLRQAEGGWTTQAGAARWYASALYRTAANDFRFVNPNAGAGAMAQTDGWERRVNNDESVATVLVGRSSAVWQMTVLSAHTARGMVGPVNVRAYDADRAITDRAMVRAHGTRGKMEWLAAARSFTLQYRDPTRPAADRQATTRSADVQVQGSARAFATLPIAWHVGSSTDDLIASGDVRQARTRAFADGAVSWERSRWRAQGGARVDVLAGARVTPSLSVATDYAVGSRVRLGARVSQALRAPTLYDLYFSTPQRLSVTALDPERVTADGEVSVRWTAAAARSTLVAEAAAVARDTRNAIVWFPGNFGWSPANVGVEHLRGLEGRLQWLTSRHEVSAWATAYDALLHTGALRIPTPYVPRLAGQAQWVMHLAGAQATVREQLLGRRPYTAGPRDAAYELPAVALLALSISHALPAHWHPPRTEARITWSLDNATNQSWHSVQGFPSPGRAWTISFTLQGTSPS